MKRITTFTMELPSHLAAAYILSYSSCSRVFDLLLAGEYRELRDNNEDKFIKLMKLLNRRHRKEAMALLFDWDL